jgi:CubicO group peptidase (beta-lactamase class C family)
MKLRYGTPEEAGMSPQRIAQVARLAEEWVHEGITPSLVVLAARRGVIVLHEAFGCLGPGPDSPVLQRDAIFPLASVTKPITATCVMQLVEDGLLGLNRPVQDYVPEFVGEGKQDVMVHHLLTHTSGLNGQELTEYAWKKAGNTGPPPLELAFGPAEEYLGARYDAPLWKAPGQEMSYCDMNYQLLGEIVRRVGDRPLAEFARERIFRPLGMEDSDYILPDARAHRLVLRPPGAPFPNYTVREHLQSGYASSSVTSTAFDMAVFGQMFLNGGEYGGVRILSRASIAEMTRNQIPGIGSRWWEEYFPEASWGYGWGIHGQGKWMYFDGTLYSPQAFMHSGAGGVYLWVDPVYEIVGVYFSVWLELLPGPHPKWCSDLFVNAITAAIVDGDGADGR